VLVSKEDGARVTYCIAIYAWVSTPHGQNPEMQLVEPASVRQRRSGSVRCVPRTFPGARSRSSWASVTSTTVRTAQASL
jgi:hypothetical protein